ncbi:hypothetical protein MPTK1_8g12340 [Marchantia polymorpha subsp. ruderalis]|uniref:Uncharacterized protein n=1 Tax=Marchantia polymorpha TaxID=3197 RepID=A0A2R6WJT3_MARPO|nr:hypothetical protein MARPO_0083s0086 [Marchantia polymorpha]BBN19639.1 hypothetical protein Mp_8g12340 [Marchantia polymorpha subsp. ruderalis]|eukprot:PTQ34128.1 hypothetical protein MARPO_0083s0086 [Marchantia polymorpha]
MVTGRGEGAAAQWAGASWPRAAGNGINGGGSSGARARPGTPPQARGHKPQKLERASRPDEAPARDKKLRVQGGALARSPRAARPPPKEVGQAPQQAPPPQAPGPHPSEAASQPASQQAPTRGGWGWGWGWRAGRGERLKGGWRPPPGQIAPELTSSRQRRKR